MRMMAAGRPSRRHPRPRRALGRGGFTLVELLTVMAIIAVLGTLLLTALAAAQKQSRQARCMANLHQTSLAMTMYLDDFDPRPRQLPTLVKARYLPNQAVLLCPQDRTRNWGGLINGDALVSAPGGLADNGRTGDPSAAAPLPAPSEPEPPLPYSYLHPLGWDDTAWAQLLRSGSLAGLAACQWHGLGAPNAGAPSVYDFEGLVLRAQRDGAVVQRKVFWGARPAWADTTINLGGLNPPAAPGGAAALTPVSYPWPLFADEPAQ